ncbi:MAG: hypothetical protein M0Q92_07530 [Methanoregula sp.]|jgi:DNA-binding helix-hairpin-helix protein with protein kinase domain|nr:hypothetical protein [Methanoregula sp.]
MAKVPIKPFFDSSGSRIVLGKKIGSGGEGDVYTIINSHNDVVAKIYHKPLSRQKQEKLLLMVKGCNDELKAISAWPTSVLHAKAGGPVVGFLMPKISDYEPVHKAYGPTHRKEVFPHADWRFLVRTAKNLAAAFYVIHKFGYVVGDVNEGNILVNQTACVRLIDCDSFQVRSGSRLFNCEVGVAHFTPPEIQEEKHYDMERTKNHDNFGLAILIFQLLFLGRHPYAGVYSGKEDMPIEKAITEYRFAYGKNSRLRMIAPPPNSVGLPVVPDEVAGFFETSFSEDGARHAGRPEAGDWWDVLEDLENHMRKCSADSMHSYYAGLSSCPWCRLEEHSGILLFLSADSITKIDIRREWQKVEAIIPPGQIPSVSPMDYAVRPMPLHPGIARSLDFRGIRQIAGVGITAVCIVMLLGEMVTDYLWFVPAAVVIAALFLYPDETVNEKRRRKASLDGARYLWDLWNKKWLAEAGDEVFFAQLNHLREFRQKYEKIGQEYKADFLSLEQTIKDRQLRQFLGRWSIDSCLNPRITAGLKNVLKAAGIRTAADIAPAALRSIPQLDNTMANELLAWRDKTARNFLFDPSKGIERDDMQALIHKYQPRMKPVERELKIGTLKLRRIQEDVVKKRITLRPAIEKRARELAQAQADYEVFGRTIEEMALQDIRRIFNIR